MTRLLLSCDNRIKKYNGNYYYKNKEWLLFYQRYLRVFDAIRIVNRCEEVHSQCGGMILIDDPRIEIVDIPDFRGPKEYFKAFFKIRNILKGVTDGCAAAIIRLPSTIGQLVCNRVMRVGMPYAVECVYDAGDAWRNEKSLVGRFIWKRIDREMRLSCYAADGVSCVTREYLQRSYYSKKDSAFYSNYSTLALDKSFYTKARSYPANKVFTIVHVANQVIFCGRKGHNQVISALSTLKSRGLNVKVVFVGADYNNGIEKLLNFAKELRVEDSIDFTGYVNRERLSSILDSADLYVMPTKAEGLPRVIIEAMAKGLPCISTNVSGNPELLDAHFLVGFDDVAALADTIQELIQNSRLYERISKENFDRSLEYEASILQERRDKFYASLRNLCVV